MTNHSIDRRDFLGMTALAVTSLLAQNASAHIAPPAPPPPAAIRLSCCAANFHGFAAGSDPLPAIQRIGQLGFDGVELIVLSPKDLTALWSGDKFDAIRRALDAGKLQVSRLVVFVPFFNDILSEEKARREVCLQHFDQACAVARQLGAPQIGYTGWSVPGTNPNVYTLKKDAQPGDKFTMPVPADLNWDQLWARAVASTKACLKIAKSHGLTVNVEPHYHGIPQSAEQFLLLHQEVKDPALGYLLDSCWTLIQCAYPPLLTKMMGPHVTNVQFRDTDATTRNPFVPFGEGVVDFAGLTATLKSVGYQGFITLEEVFMKPEVADKDAKNFVAFMRSQL